MSPIRSGNDIPRDAKRTELYRQIAEDQRQRWEETYERDAAGRDLLNGERFAYEGQQKGVMTIRQEEDDDDPDICGTIRNNKSHSSDGEMQSKLGLIVGEVDDLDSNPETPVSPLDQDIHYPPTQFPSPLSLRARCRLAFTLFSQATPSLLLSQLGFIFTGQLLDHLARWQVFQRVDELFILLPVIMNLKGNLETCLGARLGTAANQGLLNNPASRRARVITALSLLQFQALTISALAGITSFLLGLATTHRVVTTEPLTPPGMIPDTEDWGYTKPGWKELEFVISVGMITAGLSSGILGSFMTSLVVFSSWVGVDPDNILPPIAACLGDLVTLFILALIGAILVPLLGSPLVVMLVLAIFLVTVGFGLIVRGQQKRERVAAMKAALGRESRGESKEMAEGGWTPLIAAMFISLATGLVLDRGVGAYKGYALLVIGMTGLAGGLGSIHASRVSTTLHLREGARLSGRRLPPQLTPFESGLTLFVTSIPVCAVFVGVIEMAGWVDLERQLMWTFALTFLATVAVSIVAAHWMTLGCWAMRLDPDSYVLPIQSAIVDVVGQLLLVLAYKVAVWVGGDVKMLMA